jgi:hypothetical protein
MASISEASAAIAAVRCGKRVSGEHSLHSEVKPGLCPGFNHEWRVLFCNNAEDVVECYRCGAQDVTACNFDDDFA